MLIEMYKIYARCKIVDTSFYVCSKYKNEFKSRQLAQKKNSQRNKSANHIRKKNTKSAIL